MDRKREFLAFARQDGVNFSRLCRSFAISRTAGYNLLRRVAACELRGESPEQALLELSRRPRISPNRTPAGIEEAVLRKRDTYPAWGGRTIRRTLENEGVAPLPAPSTVTGILRRNGRLAAPERPAHAFIRFEHDTPNDLWQMDFKGHFPAGDVRCHPLTVLDDCSRFLIGLAACADERAETVREILTALFRLYGLPLRMLMDNGPPWGSAGGPPLTVLTVWLMRLGIVVCHSRPYHPQTQGKAERFHRTLNVELLQGRTFPDLLVCREEFDRWREVYNAVRPHQALDLDTPLSRYAPSPRPFPETLPPIEYDDGDAVRKVMAEGWVSFGGKQFRVGQALRGQPVALRPTAVDGVWSVWFMTHPVVEVDFRGPEPRVTQSPDV